MTDTGTCSSASSYRLVYTILDICCQQYGVKLVGGKHVPLDMELRPMDEVFVEEDWEDWVNEWDE